MDDHPKEDYPLVELYPPLFCSKCKSGHLYRSYDPNIFFICKQCGNILWNAPSLKAESKA